MLPAIERKAPDGGALPLLNPVLLLPGAAPAHTAIGRLVARLAGAALRPAAVTTGGV